MKLHVTGLGEIEAEYAVFVQLRNMALHSAEDCIKMAEESKEKECQYSYEYWGKLADMYIDMHTSLMEVLK